MKKIALAGATLAIAMMSASALAANSLVAGAMGVNIAMPDSGVTANTNGTSGDFVISGKYFMARDMALIAGFGLGINGSDAKGTDIGFIAGARKYLKTDDFAPFIGARFTYGSLGDSATTKVNVMGILGEAGAEYFVSRQFSVEGRVGFGYQSVERTPAGGATTKATRIGTESLGVSVNFYF